MKERAPLGRLALGTAVLAGERLGLLDRPAPGPLAILVGAAGRGRDAMRRAAEKAGKYAPRPPERVSRYLEATRERGERTIRTGRLEARGWLQNTLDDSIRWAETNVVPRVIDGAMPQIRTRVVPVIIDDLAHDDRVRTLISEQSHGVLTDATDELRQTTATADDRLESGFRRLFRA